MHASVPDVMDMCRSNVDEIASSMQHLEDMQASVEELRQRMALAHGDHQEAGESLIKLLEMLQEGSRVQAAIKESRQVSVSICICMCIACHAVGTVQHHRAARSGLCYATCCNVAPWLRVSTLHTIFAPDRNKTMPVLCGNTLLCAVAWRGMWLTRAEHAR